jgi:hypothetical protein
VLMLGFTHDDHESGRIGSKDGVDRYIDWHTDFLSRKAIVPYKIINELIGSLSKLAYIYIGH